MAILKIAKMGHPILMRRAEDVSEPASAEIAILVSDMLETLADSGGIGLAAPQVHVPKRVVIYFVPAGRTEDGKGVGLRVLINPIIEPLSSETAVDREGCLSLPGMSGLVRRPDRIRLSYSNVQGDHLEEEISGYHARVVQHECDHLDGILYPMRMEDISSLGYVEEMAKADVSEEPTDVSAGE